MLALAFAREPVEPYGQQPPEPRRAAEEGPWDGTDAFLARLETLARGDVRALPAHDAKRLVELTVRLARGRGADDLRIGEALARLRHHDMLLSYNGIGDLALGELGIDAAHGRWLASIAAKLASRPLLRAAIVSGEVSLRKADAVVDVALGEHERYWVERAKLDTVRDLERATKDGEVPAGDWRDVLIRMRTPYKEAIQHGFEVAAVVLGNLDVPRWKIIEAMCQEYVGNLVFDDAPSAPVRSPGSLREWLAAMERTALQRSVDPRRPLAAAAPAGGLQAGDEDQATGPPELGPVRRPRRLLRELKQLVRDRLPDDERLGRACLLVRWFAAWRPSTPAPGAPHRGAYAQDELPSFEAFCVERLGLAPSTVRQRVNLEWRLRSLPQLRAALRSGAVSYEKARAVARVALPSDVESRIEEAASKPCLQVKREAEEEVDRQMWRTGRVRTPMPEEVNELFLDTIQSIRRRAGAPMDPDAALFILAYHFERVWGAEAERLLRQADPVMRRDRGRCQVPGCSHRAAHLHHVRFRSRGGTDHGWNKVAVCEAHHLAGIHQGYIIVTGTAPDGLVWEFPGRDMPEPEAEA